LLLCYTLIINLNKGGTTYITSSDDGINAAGGSDTSSSEGFGRVMTSSTGTLYINGGYKFIYAKGDGLDSNGSIYVKGGFTVVNQEGNGNAPIDKGDAANSVFNQTGGVLIAYGASDMLVNATEGNTYSILTIFNQVSTSNYLIVETENIKYAIKPYKSSAYSLYIGSKDFTKGSVKVSYTSSITGAKEIFGGVYKEFETSNTSNITSGTWTDSNIHLGQTSGAMMPGGNQNPQGGPGGGRRF
jgi:hypothetical protein